MTAGSVEILPIRFPSYPDIHCGRFMKVGVDPFHDLHDFSSSIFTLQIILNKVALITNLHISLDVSFHVPSFTNKERVRWHIPLLTVDAVIVLCLPYLTYE